MNEAIGLSFGALAAALGALLLGKEDSALLIALCIMLSIASLLAWAVSGGEK